MKHLKKKLTILATLFSSILFSVQTSFAQITNPAIGESLGDDAEAAASGEIFLNYFVNIWNSVVTVGGFLVLIYFIWGAFEWITAGGDSGKLQTARNKMLHAAIGLLILVSSFVILGFISNLFFGEEFSILNLNFTAAGGTE